MVIIGYAVVIALSVTLGSMLLWLSFYLAGHSLPVLQHIGIGALWVAFVGVFALIVGMIRDG